MARRRSEEEPVAAVCLKYTGGDTGDRILMGVPAADLHEVPAEEAEGLVDSGLYVLIPDCSHGEQAATGD